jgi:hypothetical protein
MDIMATTATTAHFTLDSAHAPFMAWELARFVLSTARFLVVQSSWIDPTVDVPSTMADIICSILYPLEEVVEAQISLWALFRVIHDHAQF